MDYRCDKYGKDSPKWLCPVENDNLDCKDCIWSSLID